MKSNNVVVANTRTITSVKHNNVESQRCINWIASNKWTGDCREAGRNMSVAFKIETRNPTETISYKIKTRALFAVCVSRQSRRLCFLEDGFQSLDWNRCLNETRREHAELLFPSAQQKKLFPLLLYIKYHNKSGPNVHTRHCCPFCVFMEAPCKTSKVGKSDNQANCGNRLLTVSLHANGWS